MKIATASVLANDTWEISEDSYQWAKPLAKNPQKNYDRLGSEIFENALSESKTLTEILDDDIDIIKFETWEKTISLTRKIHTSVFSGNRIEVIPELNRGNNCGIDVSWTVGKKKLVIATAELDNDYEFLYYTENSTIIKGRKLGSDWEGILQSLLRQICSPSK